MARGHLRLFVAITLPLAVREAIAAALERTAAIAPGARVVPLENVHVTLRFLGATPPDDRPGIERAVAAAAAASAPFPVVLGGAGSFGPRGRPRVLYAGVADGAPSIAGLAARVRAALAIEEPEPRFTPHVTLATARGQRGDPDLARARRELEGLTLPSFVVSSIALVQSELSEKPARYRILQEAPFPA